MLQSARCFPPAAEVAMPSDVPEPRDVPDMHTVPALYTEAEAQAVWARAAELQRDASDAVRRDYGLLTGGSAPQGSTLPGLVPPAGMFFEHEIIAAAADAGIDPVHVAVALAEHDAAEKETWVVPTDEQRRLFVQELGTDAGALQTVGFTAGSPTAVMHRMREAFGDERWHMQFDGVVQSSVDGAQVLRFRLPLWLGDGSNTESLPPWVTNAFVYNANRIGVHTVHVLVMPRGTKDATACEVTIIADLRLGQHYNAVTMRWLYRFLAVCITCAGVPVGMIAATPDAALLSLPALAGALTGGALSLALTRFVRGVMRWEQRTAMRVLAREFRRMLHDIGQPRRPLAVETPVSPSLPHSTTPRPTDTHHELRAAHAG